MNKLLALLFLISFSARAQEKKQIIIPPSKDTTVIDLTVTSVATASTVTDYKVTSRATVEAPPVVIPPVTGASLPTKAADFDGTTLAAWPVKAGSVKEVTIAGKQALFFAVTPTMPEVGNGRRSEVNLLMQKYKDPFGVWLTQSIYIPSTTIPDNPLLYDVITQFHDPNETSATLLRKSPFDLVLSASTLDFQIRTDKDLNGTKMLSVPVTYDKWMDIVIHIVFSGSGKGQLQIWINGKQSPDYKGNVGFSGGTYAPFLKVGDYFYAWNSNDKSQLPYVKSTKREIYIAGFKLWYE